MTSRLNVKRGEAIRPLPSALNLKNKKTNMIFNFLFVAYWSLAGFAFYKLTKYVIKHSDRL